MIPLPSVTSLCTCDIRAAIFFLHSRFCSRIYARYLVKPRSYFPFHFIALHHASSEAYIIGTYAHFSSFISKWQICQILISCYSEDILEEIAEAANIVDRDIVKFHCALTLSCLFKTADGANGRPLGTRHLLAFPAFFCHTLYHARLRSDQ